MIGAIAQKLLDQVSVGCMNFDPVEAGGKSVAGGGSYSATIWGISSVSSARGVTHGWNPRAVNAVAFGQIGRRRNRQCTGRLQQGMGDAPNMPQLDENTAAFGVNPPGNLFPCLDLRGIIVPGVNA